MSNGLRVIVEDDEVDVMNVERAFTRNSHRRSFTSSRTMAVRGAGEIRSGRISRPFERVVLLDLNMPRMNGIDVLREVRTILPYARRPWSRWLTTSTEFEQDSDLCLQSERHRSPLEPVTFTNFCGGHGSAEQYWSLVEFP